MSIRKIERPHHGINECFHLPPTRPPPCRWGAPTRSSRRTHVCVATEGVGRVSASSSNSASTRRGLRYPWTPLAQKQLRAASWSLVGQIPRSSASLCMTSSRSMSWSWRRLTSLPVFRPRARWVVEGIGGKCPRSSSLRSVRASADGARPAFPIWLAQQVLHDLAGAGQRQCIAELNAARALIAGDERTAVGNNVL